MDAPAAIRLAPVNPWTPADYLLRGRYCETEAIEFTLQQVRELAHADLALLLAFRGATLFYSLLLLSHRDPDVAREHRRVLTAPLTRGYENAPYVGFDPAVDDSRRLVDELVADPPFDAIAPLLAGDATVFSRRPPPGPPHERGIEPAAFHVLLVNAQRPRDTFELAAAVDSLVNMVNASAPVVVHGNLAAEQDVGAAMAEIDPIAGLDQADEDRPLRGIIAFQDSSVERRPQAMLETALALTGSSVGNIYLDTRERDLSLVAEVRNENRLPRLSIDDPESVVAWVYRRERSMVINDIRDFHRSVLPDGERAYAELAVPIVQSRLGTGGSTVIGVINVEKVEGIDEGHYTYRDLSVVRLIANRLSSWRSQMLMSQFSRSLDTLSSPRAATVRSLSDGCGQEPARPELPQDALPAKPTIDEMLKGIFEMTRSRSATVRLLSSDLRSLTRFSAFPRERLNDRRATIAVSDRRSVNAWVAREGLPCYLRSPSSYRRYERLQGVLDARPRFRSTLCHPLLVAGRVVGTLNLESLYDGGYDDALDAVQMVAGQIGLALQHVRRAQEQEVFSMTIAATANGHEIFKQTDRLRKSRPDDPEIVEVADIVEALIDPGTRPIESDDEYTTQELLEETIDKLRVRYTLEPPAPPPRELVHSGVSANILRIAFGALLENADERAASLRGSWMRWREERRGGQLYLTLSVCNPIDDAIDDERAAALYRRPLRHSPDSRMHIGAYTAAALVRSLGGDIFIERNEPPLFIANLQLPVATDDGPGPTKGIVI